MKLNGHDVAAETLKQVIAEQAVLGDKTFAVIGDESVTYGEIDAQAARIANALRLLGVGKGDVVATFMHNSVDHLTVWFACAKAGAVWAPFNTGLVLDDLAYTLADSRPALVVVDAALAERFRIAMSSGADVPGRVVLRGSGDLPGSLPFEELTSGPDGEPDVVVNRSDPAGIIYTGGSTGRPKGVLVANSWYFPGVLRYREMLDPTSDDVHLGLGQMFHTIGSAVDLFSPFVHGMTSVSMGWFSTSRFLETVRRHGVTVSVILGAHIARLMKTERLPDDHENPLRRAISVTGGLPRSIVEDFSRRYDVPLLETYGQTETGPLGCINQRIEDLPRAALGSAHGWIDVRIADEAGRAVQPGETGEILLRPAVPGSFMLGYVGKPDQFVHACRDLWFHTGDLGRIDEHGDVHFRGRTAHLLRHKGENVSAVEIEEVFLGHPAVGSCGVVGVPSDMGDDDIKVFVVPSGEAPAPAELLEYCAARLAAFKVPRFVEFVESLPLSQSKGEVERFRLTRWGTGRCWDRETTSWHEPALEGAMDVEVTRSPEPVEQAR
jgi:crotonobetaine/carnitine-CoA ligase